MKGLEGIRWRTLISILSFALPGFSPAIAAAQESPAAPHIAAKGPPQSAIDGDGTVHLPAISVPFSSLASPQAKAEFLEMAAHPLPSPADGLTEWREAMNKQVYAPLVARLKDLFPVSIRSETIAGVYTEVITPKNGVSRKNKDRVLINLHGGAFMVGGRTPNGGGIWAGPQESIRIAHEGMIKVVTLDYRMFPEYKFPAATEDVAAVYKELLKQYPAENIGIYGCSAGGMLTAQAVAWFQAHGLPRPGAIGIFCAGATAGMEGDSAYVAPALNGADAQPATAPLGYFVGADPKDPLLSPGSSPATLAKFPPTLVITGTRDMALSAAVHTHAELVKTGVEADLHVWEGIGHGKLYDPTTPEGRDATNVIVKFFDKHLDVTKRKSAR